QRGNLRSVGLVPLLRFPGRDFVPPGTVPVGRSLSAVPQLLSGGEALGRQPIDGHATGLPVRDPGKGAHVSRVRIIDRIRLRRGPNPAEKPLGLYANWKKIEKNRRIKDPPWGPLFLFQRSKAIFLMFWQTAVMRHCSVTLASPLIRA